MTKLTTDQLVYFLIFQVFERVIDNEISEYIELFLSELLTRFRKNQNTQHYLLKMLENCKKALGNGISVLSSWTWPKRLVP